MGTWQEVFMLFLLALPWFSILHQPCLNTWRMLSHHMVPLFKLLQDLLVLPAAVNKDAFVMCCLISMEHESQ